METLNIEILNTCSFIVAYIDPGSGSAIISAIIGFFVAAGLVIKTYWYKIKNFFSGNKAEENQNATTTKVED